MKSNKPPIKFEQIGIGGILRHYNLKVPSHQRDYSWTDKEVTNLFQDLAKAIADNEQEYFLGTIVTIPDANGILEVIDGQQRLATATILLSQIRAYLTGKDDVIVQDLNNFLSYTDRNQRATLPKLKLNLVDNTFFGEMLSDDKTPQPQRISHRLLCDAFKKSMEHVLKIVSTTDVKEHGDMLNKWISFLEDGAEVILLQIPTGANAYKMFETLNDRGLRTTQADLVKNYLFSQADDRLPEAQHSWSIMRGILETLQEDADEDITVTFLRHVLIIMGGILKTNEVYEAVQKRAKGSKNSIGYLKDIESLASLYVATFRQDSEKWAGYPDAMRKAIETLNFFNIHPFRPALLAIAARFSPLEATKAFQMLISLGVRLLIASSTRSGSIEENMGTAANKIFMDKIKTSKELKEEISNIVPSDEVFRQAFETATISKASLARYYLRSLEKVAKKEPVPWFVVNDDKEQITLEHVLPTNPEGNWPFSDEEIDAFHRRLGNMVLLSRKANSELKSAAFQQKKKMFKDCPYELTRQIEALSNWSPESIVNRQKKLAELALTAWPL